MPKKCTYHVGLDATIEVGGKSYCAKCEAAQKAAAKLLDKHVIPKDCFVWFDGGYRWIAVGGTGCAHWVAHQKNITNGPLIHRCLEGKTFKVSDIATNRTQISDLINVKVGDIYITPTKKHCGLVSRVTLVPGGTPKIEIQHDSSNQGGVKKNDFATYFHGNGSFFR